MTQMGLEVRLLRSHGDGRVHGGVLVANFGGQWLPIEFDKMPDGNVIVR
jgi:hypothetical protein